MFRLPLLVCAAAILLTPSISAAESTRRLCFSRDQGVWISNLDGTNARKIVAGADMNSNNRIEPAIDGKSFLVDADLNEEGDIKSWDGPPPAVFLFDTDAGKARRVSKVYAWDPCWLDAQIYLFTSTIDGRHFGIYKASLTGEKPQIVVNNASSVSVSGPQ